MNLAPPADRIRLPGCFLRLTSWRQNRRRSVGSRDRGQRLYRLGGRQRVRARRLPRPRPGPPVEPAHQHRSGRRSLRGRHPGPRLGRSRARGRAPPRARRRRLPAVGALRRRPAAHQRRGHPHRHGGGDARGRRADRLHQLGRDLRSAGRARPTKPACCRWTRRSAPTSAARSWRNVWSPKWRQAAASGRDRQSIDADRPARRAADADRPHRARSRRRPHACVRRHRTQFRPRRRRGRRTCRGVAPRSDRRALHPGRREHHAAPASSPTSPRSSAAGRRRCNCRAPRSIRSHSAPRWWRA